jgi:predicted Zn finger-like uncharacterized protein
MLVQCPECKTTYKVSDEVVKGAAPAFRCSRCKHTFEVQLTTESAPDTATRGRGTGESSELAFPFEAVAPAEPEPARGDAPPRADSPAPGPADAGKTIGTDRADRTVPKNSNAVKSPHLETPSSAPAEGLHPVAQPPQETFDKVLNIAPYREQRASAMPFLTLFGLFVVLAALVLAYQKNYPAASEGWLASIPLLGPSVMRNNHLKHGVLLKSLETKFQVLQGNREAVVLTGVAVNQNPVMIRNVQLSGRSFDHEGREIERQTMWIGNAISSQIIRGMTAQDIIDLQRLKPLKTFEIPPGDSVPFAIVFLRPGKSLKDVRCEVLSVEAV